MEVGAMPREQITEPSTRPIVETDPADGVVPPLVVSTPQLHVSWTKADNEYGRAPIVQVALQVDAKHVEERAKSNGEVGVVGFNWFYTESLDRHAINKLIRTLRRARDTAFGRDE